MESYPSDGQGRYYLTPMLQKDQSAARTAVESGRATPSKGRRLLGAALTAPLAAGAPVLLIGYAAYLVGSPSFPLYVEAFFQILTLAWPVALIVGLPLHFVLRRLGWAHPLAYACAGAAIALAAHGLLGEEAAQIGPAWESSRGIALLCYGSLAGYLFRRRIGP